MGEGERVMATVREHFDSIDAVLAILAKSRPADAGCSSEKENREDSWDLSLGWSGAFDAYTGGWAEGAAKAYALAETLKVRPTASRTAFHSSVTGAFPNVGAYLAGNPKSMYAVSKKQAAGKPFVNLYLPIGYHCGIDANVAFDRGCAMVALIDALESAGCRCRVTLIDVMSLGYGSGAHYVGYYTVKDYSQRLDIDQVIFTAAHPAFFRRIRFALWERSENDAVRSCTRGGYGSPTGTTAGDCPEDGPAVTVELPRLESNRLNGATPTPEAFLAQMVAALPETLRTEIQDDA